jgi:hypothetical protein
MSFYPQSAAEKKRWLIGLLVALTIWGLLDVRRRGHAPADSPQGHKSDLTVYTEAGAAFFDGRPPYDVCNPRGWTYVYPPIFAMLLAPLHALPMQDQVTLWFFLCLAMCWGIFCESRRLAAIVLAPSNDDRTVGEDRRPRWVGAMTVATVALPTLNCLQRGQATVAVVYLLLLGLRLILEKPGYLTTLAGGIVLALSITIKVIPLLPVGFLLFLLLVGYFQRRRQQEPTLAARLGRQLFGATAGVGLGLLLFFFILPAALIGWEANAGHLDTWAHRVLFSAGDSTATPGFDADTHSVRNQCLGNALYRLGNFGDYLVGGGSEDPLVDDANPPPRLMDAASVNTSLLVVRLTLLLTLGIVGWRVGRSYPTSLSLAAGFGLACAALLVVSPVARNHYFVLLAPAVLFVPLWFDDLGRRRWATVLAIVPCVLILLQYIFLPYVGRIGLLGLGTTAWVMAVMVLMVRACRVSTIALSHPQRVETQARHRCRAA